MMSLQWRFVVFSFLRSQVIFLYGKKMSWIFFKKNQNLQSQDSKTPHKFHVLILILENVSLDYKFKHDLCSILCRDNFFRLWIL
jgi:hypothetical protein